MDAAASAQQFHHLKRSSNHLVVVQPSSEVPVVASSKRWKSDQVTMVAEVKTSSSCLKDAALYQEPTSVLDLQTSPGRSSSSTASLSSQQSLSSGEETSFSAHTTNSGDGVCSSEERSSAEHRHQQGEEEEPLNLLQEQMNVAASELNLQQQHPHLGDQDIASWMDCMEDPDGPLGLSDFEECEAGGSHSSVLKVQAEIDFAGAVDLDFGFDEAFPNFLPVSAGLIMSEMLSDVCFMDEPKPILLPEGFQEDDSLSSMLGCSSIRSGAGGATCELTSVSNSIGGLDIPLLQQDSQSCAVVDNSLLNCRQKSIRVETDSFNEDGSPHPHHNRSESWGSSGQVQVSTTLQQQPEDSGLHLVHLLLACAEAIDETDFDSARPMLTRLRTTSNPYGDPMQRIALYFADALSDRLATELILPGTFSSESSSSMDPSSSPSSSSSSSSSSSLPPSTSPCPSASSANLERELAYQAFYEKLPFAKFAHLTANQAIYEAVALSSNSKKVHVVDLDIQQGLQWPSFIQSLAMRPGGPPHLRVTAVGTNATALQLTGRRLSEFAQALDVPFDFTPAVVERLDNLSGADLMHIAPDEALAINCSHVLHTLAGNPAGLERILSLFRSLNPRVVTLLEVEANHDGPSLILRFVEALHHYCALFDCLEGSLGRDSPERFRIESTAFALEIKDIVALEGSKRRNRHVKFETWQSRFAKAGLRAKSLSSFAVKQAQLLLEFLATGSNMLYKLSEEGSALILGWQDTPVVAVSSWSC
jgi:hypothetical protein